jgi:hypothetical protein
MSTTNVAQKHRQPKSGIETTARELAVELWGEDLDRLPENTKAEIFRQAREIELKKALVTARGEDERKLF